MKFKAKIYYVDDSWDVVETEDLREVEKKIEDGPGVSVISSITVEIVREGPRSFFGAKNYNEPIFGDD